VDGTLGQRFLMLDYLADFFVGVVVGGLGGELPGALVHRDLVQFGGAAALEVVAHFCFVLVWFS
jgi:hypothetical protein